MTSPAARVTEVARASYGKLVAILGGRSGDIQAAEDALADAFEQALKTWPRDGVPARPEAWLLTVARNRRTDMARRAARMTYTDEVPDMPAPIQWPQDDIPDERLRLLFVCAHPAIDPEIHTPLMLQTVLGVEAADIASAFLVPAATMAQRLVRAKRKIKTARIPFAEPAAQDRIPRRGAVLEAIYGAFSLDWDGAEAPLADEALYLALLIARLMPEDPEALGLAALVAHVHARRRARQTGAYVPVAEQDMALWDGALIDQANGMLVCASALGQIGRFQLEAAIQSVHAARRDTGRTDWRALTQLHTGLLAIAPSLGAAVSHAAAVAEDAGPDQALALLDRIAPDDIATYQPAWATRAHVLARLKRPQEAAAAYDRAIALTQNTEQRTWLSLQRTALALI